MGLILLSVWHITSGGAEKQAGSAEFSSYSMEFLHLYLLCLLSSIPMFASEPHTDIAGMTAIPLRAVCHELPATSDTFRTLGRFAHVPMLMPPAQATGVRAELLLLSAQRVYQRATTSPAYIVCRGRRFTDSFQAVALAIRLDGIYRHAQLPRNLRISHALLDLLGDEHFLSVCHTTSSVILMNRRGKPPQMIFSPQIARLSSNTQFI